MSKLSNSSKKTQKIEYIFLHERYTLFQVWFYLLFHGHIILRFCQINIAFSSIFIQQC